ncbi:hypothetical protein IFM89_018414 [Coptis chinensis]|uniref:Uncharacterized protein n=1 Tax=Coptis chinensis TaxID=261450 RepID=A0A835HKS1_9MAGN|nr:hypothetical protein IFM89_018414 [Coptis chinensis]
MDELIRNIYGENPPPPSTPPPPDIVIDGVLESQLQQTGTKTAEEVWKEISGGSNNNNNEDGIEEEEEEEEKKIGRLEEIRRNDFRRVFD